MEEHYSGEMNERLPKEVREELGKALVEIARVLARTNASLSEKNLGDYATAAATIIHNDPERPGDVDSSSILLAPVGEDGRETDFDVIEEVSVVPIYSPTKEKVAFKKVKKQSLSSCHEATDGECCDPKRVCLGFEFNGKLVSYECYEKKKKPC